MSNTTPHNQDHGEPSRRLSRRAFIHGAALTGATAAAAPIIASCGGSDKPSSSTATTTTTSGGAPTSAALQAPSSAPTTGVLYPPDYVGPVAAKIGPITTEKVTLTVVAPQDVQVGDWNKNDFSTWYEKRTGVHVNYQVVATGGDEMTKVNAMIAAGDMPDVFLGIDFTASQIQLYGPDQKVFVPLSDYIDKYCPQTQKVFHDYPNAKKLHTMLDGQIYSLPNVNDCFHCNARNNPAWIYKPWLDELNLTMPETLDDFENVLTEFKNKDPNKNGKADEIPFTTCSNTTHFDGFIMGSFLYNPGSPWLSLDKGKVQAVFTQDGWRRGLQYLNKLYGKGLIPKETFTRTEEQVQRLGNAATPVLGVVCGFYQGTFIDINTTGDNARYQDYVCVPMLKGSDGTRIAEWDYYKPYIVGSFMVTKKCKNPAIAAMWGDGMYELETTARSVFGVLDSDWGWAKKGEVGINGQQAIYTEISNYPPAPGHSWAERGIPYRSSAYRLAETVDTTKPTFEKPLYEGTKTAYYPYREQQDVELPPLILSSDQAGQVADLKTTITNYVEQSMTNFIVGKQDPNDDKAWTSYLSTLKSMDLPTYLSINQKAFESAQS
jgi:putative aldouronate transport system substrate-binding protein